MKVVKIEWMNDERKSITVRVLDLRYDPTTGKGDEYGTLAPCQNKEFDVQMPDNATLYVKKWPEMVMLSYREGTASLPSSQSALQPQDLEGAPEDPSQE